MSAGVVEQSADVVVAGNHLTDSLTIKQFQLAVAVAFPQPLLCFQMPHLPGGERGEHPAVLQVALDVVAFDPLADDPAALEGHLPHQCGGVRAGTALDHIDVAAITVDDLPAVAA
ncbi:hypothetical protein D3C78_1433490 [compost metagenome]